jgi:hypothetical protein
MTVIALTHCITIIACMILKYANMSSRTVLYIEESVFLDCKNEIKNEMFGDW